MRLARLALSNFRNYDELEFEPQPGLNVFIGKNAQGKSNLLEAIAMLGIGKSFRTTRDADTIRTGEQRAIIRGDVVRDDEERTTIACSIARLPRGARKTFSRGGRNVSYAAFLGTLSVVTFVPADLQMVTGSPSLRRAFLNTMLAQQDRAYYRSLARYQATLRQKNALLRGPSEPDEALLSVYDASLADAGGAIMVARSVAVEALAREALTVHAAWTHGAERLEVRYAPNVATAETTEEGVRDAIARRQGEQRAMERARKTTIVGPHRDDVTFVLDGEALATYGSQGQQRTAVLALKAAEYTVMRDRTGAAPLLLLDDFLSELDEQRAAAFLTGVGEYEQAFVTATHQPPTLPARSVLFSVADAAICAETTC